MPNSSPSFTPPILERQPDMVVHGAEATAPAAATVLASGQLTPPGTPQVAAGWLVSVNVSSDDGVPSFEIAHRNAANTADIDVAYISANATPGAWHGFFFCGAGEYIVVRNKTAGTASKVYQADIYAWRI